MQNIHGVQFDKVFFNYPTTTIKTPWPVGNSGYYYEGHIICVAQKALWYYIGIAKCVSPDQFNKKIGREISYGRAEKAYNGTGRSIPEQVQIKTKTSEKVFSGLMTEESYHALNGHGGLKIG